MHLRQLNLSITSVLSHITSPPSTTTALDDSTNNANINAIIQVVTTIIIIIMAVVFVACALFYCFNRTLANGCCGVDGGGEEDEPENNGNGGRRRRLPGLSRAVIDTFPTYLYSDVRVHRLGNDELECAVCLNEFKDVEVLRVLPTCCHVFHPDCIDTWLLSRATCPVCRANVGSISNLTEQEGLGRILGITGFDDDEDHTGDEILIEQSPGVEIRSTPPDTSTSTTRWFTCNHPKSHSTGHSPLWTTHQTDRFTLRLPEEVRYRLATGAPWLTGGVMGLVSSPRSWYRHPSNIVGCCRNNEMCVIRKSNYHHFRTRNNNNDNDRLCLGEPIPSPKSDGPVDYSTLVNIQR